MRGSNSASYGARAFLGVVNIISRDVRETQGAAASVARGENGIADAGARFGWSSKAASFRLSADSVSDDGLQGAFGASHTERLNISSHFRLDQGAELALRAGGVGKVIASKNDKFAVGDFVSAGFGVQEYITVAADEIKRNGLVKIDLRAGTLTQWLNVLGMPGMTGYFGLMDVGMPTAGETVVVSGAAGAVRQGRRRPRRSGQGLPAVLGGERVGHELRLAQRQRHRGTQQGLCHRRSAAHHR